MFLFIFFVWSLYLFETHWTSLRQIPRTFLPSVHEIVCWDLFIFAEENPPLSQFILGWTGSGNAAQRHFHTGRNTRTLRQCARQNRAFFFLYDEISTPINFYRMAFVFPRGVCACSVWKGLYAFIPPVGIFKNSKNVHWAHCTLTAEFRGWHITPAFNPTA